MAELVDAADLKSVFCKEVRVQVPPRPPFLMSKKKTITFKSKDLKFCMKRNGDKYEISVRNENARCTYDERKWPIPPKEHSIELTQKQLVSLAKFVNDNIHSFPPGNIDFGTSME